MTPPLNCGKAFGSGRRQVALAAGLLRRWSWASAMSKRSSTSKTSREVGDGEDVGVEVQRALEAGARHGVDARAEPDVLEQVHLGEGRVGEGRVGPEVDGEAGGDAGDRGGGAGGERPVARTGRDEENAVPQSPSPSAQVAATLAEGGWRGKPAQAGAGSRRAAPGTGGKASEIATAPAASAAEPT